MTSYLNCSVPPKKIRTAKIKIWLGFRSLIIIFPTAPSSRWVMQSSFHGKSHLHRKNFPKLNILWLTINQTRQHCHILQGVKPWNGDSGLLDNQAKAAIDNQEHQLFCHNSLAFECNFLVKNLFIITS